VVNKLHFFGIRSRYLLDIFDNLQSCGNCIVVLCLYYVSLFAENNRHTEFKFHAVRPRKEKFTNHFIRVSN